MVDGSSRTLEGETRSGRRVGQERRIVEVKTERADRNYLKRKQAVAALLVEGIV
jgi:hypothetical protein